MTMRAARMSGFQGDLILRNKYMIENSKTRIYRTVVRPMMIFAAEAGADTTKTMQTMRTAQN